MPRSGMFDETGVRQPDLANLGRDEGGDDAALKYPRLHGRLPLETLSCNLGEVLDISGGGMRVRCSRLPAPADGDDSNLVSIQITDHPELKPLHARIVWSKKTGWLRHEFGVQFENLTAEQSQMLSQIAITYRERRSM